MYFLSAVETATGGITFAWTPPTYLSCVTCSNPIATPQQTTTYNVIVTDANNCKDTAQITITIEKGCTGEDDLFVANIFSPNNDGKNDLLQLQGNGLSDVYWTIYDR